MSFLTLSTRLLLCGGLVFATAQHAQAQAAATTTTATDLKDGAYRRNGVVMRLQAGQSSRLSAPMKFNNGTTLRPDGIMVSKDGTRQLLGEGKALNLQGDIVNLRDDMKTAEAIERHDEKVTGYKPTVISTPAPAQTTSPELQAAMRRTEERLATLQQMSTLLDQRASTVVGATPQAQPLDARLRELDAKLKP